ncbi:MAG: hypothetical protein AAGI71_01180 [Bacteroidota bacterium]
MERPANAPPRPVCSCGHDRYHHYARPQMRYGGGGWLLLFSGASATPKAITFTCARCGEVIEQTTEPTVLREFLNH